MSTSFPNPLTEKEEQHYVKLLEQNDPKARAVLIERNLRLVAHIAKKYVGPGNSQDDMISIGTIGLIKAVNTYSGKKSTRLATYAAKCIENEILMSIRASKRIKQDISLSPVSYTHLLVATLYKGVGARRSLGLVLCTEAQSSVVIPSAKILGS